MVTGRQKANPETTEHVNITLSMRRFTEFHTHTPFLKFWCRGLNTGSLYYATFSDHFRVILCYLFWGRLFFKLLSCPVWAQTWVSKEVGLLLWVSRVVGLEVWATRPSADSLLLGTIRLLFPFLVTKGSLTVIFIVSYSIALTFTKHFYTLWILIKVRQSAIISLILK